ncbi:Imm21 family immunity protein [Streptomyces achromogenes]|uniref:Imm21 family immunity protein n=1 Tax=Streptomyces achromogenes TaxID=67255 RepID=UPI0031588330
MHASHDTDRCDRAGLTWARSMGGPLIVVPESSVNAWGECTEDGSVLGDADGRDDYDRACEVEAGPVRSPWARAPSLRLSWPMNLQERASCRKICC